MHFLYVAIFLRLPQIGLMSVARFSWVPNLYNLHFLLENHRPQPDPVILTGIIYVCIFVRMFVILWKTCSHRLGQVKIFFFSFFYRFGYHFIYHFFFHLCFHSFFFIILFFIFLSFFLSFFFIILFFIFFIIFFQSFFSSSGAKKIQKMENCNFPRVFFIFLSFFYHFCFQWWNWWKMMKNDGKW